jgi:hypothetical protein
VGDSKVYRLVMLMSLDRVHPHLQLLAELAPAIIVHRTIFGEDLDPESFSEDVLALFQAVADKPTN